MVRTKAGSVNWPISAHGYLCCEAGNPSNRSEMFLRQKLVGIEIVPAGKFVKTSDDQFRPEYNNSGKLDYEKWCN